MEICGKWMVSDNWRLSAWYSILHPHFSNAMGNNATYIPDDSPANQVRFYSSWDIGNSWNLDLGLRYVDQLADGSIPAYLTMDLRLAWHPNDQYEVALVGRNLLDNHHPEFAYENYGYVVDEVRRTAYAQLTWRR